MMLAAVRSEINDLVIFQRKKYFYIKNFQNIDNKNVGIYNFTLLRFTTVYLLNIQTTANVWLMMSHLWRS